MAIYVKTDGILHLTLKKKWFDMILSGEKKEEYRETKGYWIERLSKIPLGENFNGWEYHKIAQFISSHKGFKTFDSIIFRNGYSKNAPEINIRLKNISVRTGNFSWGANEGTEYFVLELGDIISQKNIKTCEPTK